MKIDVFKLNSYFQLLMKVLQNDKRKANKRREKVGRKTRENGKIKEELKNI